MSGRARPKPGLRRKPRLSTWRGKQARAGTTTALPSQSANGDCSTLQARGDVLDDNLYTAPGKFGAAGAGTTWLVGSASEVASSLQKYRDLGIKYFILSDTPYLAEIERQGKILLPLLRD